MQRAPRKPAYEIRELIMMVLAATTYGAITTSHQHRADLFTNTIKFNPQNSRMQLVITLLIATALCCFQIWTLVSSDGAEVRCHLAH